MRNLTEVYTCKECEVEDQPSYVCAFCVIERHRDHDVLRLEIAGSKDCSEAILRVEMQIAEFRTVIEKLLKMKHGIETKLKYCNTQTLFTYTRRSG
ncbi:hypothetical protein L596_028449 [Steinernema carpocapsae]|uniref:UBR-type domain-containing protein n=1 Tax=Steinernema carpocapsae TaxID=34508 RepID=A0A4U5LYG8_STECR|nr:hypothetical protein L596_028449 [Steinernema carpocapsae]